MHHYRTHYRIVIASSNQGHAMACPSRSHYVAVIHFETFVHCEFEGRMQFAPTHYTPLQKISKSNTLSNCRINFFM